MTSKPCEAALSVQMQSNNHSVCVKNCLVNFSFHVFFLLGYTMIVEVKSNQKAFQRAKKQLFDGQEKIEEVFAAIGLTTTSWLYVGVFFALIGDEEINCDCDICSHFAIIGEESIPKKLKIIEELVAKHHLDWNPHEHVKEFVDLAKETLLIAQGMISLQGSS